MTDIVERIREEVRDWKCGPVVSEAADEIERLRDVIASMQKRLDRWEPKSTFSSASTAAQKFTDRT
jgi:ubiquinone biosynthesis protein UbiJ